MRRLIVLYLKELSGAWMIVLGTAALIVLWNLFLRVQTFWEAQSAFALSTMALSAVIILGVLFAQGVDREWRSGTAYWLLSLPVSGYTILAAKFGLGLSFLLLNTLLAVTGGVFTFRWVYGGWIAPGAAALFYLYFLGFGTMVLLLGLLARTAGLAVRRGRLPVVVGVFWGGAWLLVTFTRLMNEVCAFLPALTVPTGINWGLDLGPSGFVSICYFGQLPLATVLAWALYGAAVFWLTGWLLDRRVEI